MAAVQSASLTSRRPSTVPSLVNKAAAAIHIKNDISCLQRKLWNVLLSNSYADLPNPDVQIHEIKIKDLMDEVGFDSKNIAYLRQALEDMVSTKLTWNILDEKGKQEWGVSAALASAVLTGGMCYYAYSAHLRQKLHNPEFYAPVPLSVLRRFGSGHALALYENCLRYRTISQTPWFSIDVFRDLLGVGDNSSYDDFKVLNRAVIKSSVNEVNTVSDIRLEPQLMREKRKVVGIKFVIDGNQQEVLPIESTDNNFNADILDRLQDTFCLSEKQAKETLVTHSEDRIEAVMGYVEERYKLGKIKEGKIAPYFLRTLKDFDPASTKISSIDRKKRADEDKKATAAQRKAQVNEMREKFVEGRKQQVEDYCSNIEETKKQVLLEEFGDFLKNTNPAVFQFYRKNGFKAHAAYIEFIKFVGEKVLPPFDAAFRSFLKQNGLAEV